LISTLYLSGALHSQVPYGRFTTKQNSRTHYRFSPPEYEA
jgi:hypothetical protein